MCIFFRTTFELLSSISLGQLFYLIFLRCFSKGSWVTIAVRLESTKTDTHLWSFELVNSYYSKHFISFCREYVYFLASYFLVKIINKSDLQSILSTSHTYHVPSFVEFLLNDEDVVGKPGLYRVNLLHVSLDILLFTGPVGANFALQGHQYAHHRAI